MRRGESKTIIEKSLERIRERRWTKLSQQWMPHIPSINPAGSAPRDPLNTFYGFEQAAKHAIVSSPYREEVAGVRQLVLWEGIYLLHKAAHVVGAAEQHAKSGMQTWSLSGGYHGALFAAKAILHMLGVALPEYRVPGKNQNKSVLVDLWPEMPKLSSKQKQRGITNPPEIEFSYLGLRMENRHVWRILRRVINVSRIDIWPVEYVRALRKVGPAEFGWQRNVIHYDNCRWFFDDLHQLVLDMNFGVPDADIAKSLEFSRNTTAFSLILGLVLFKLAKLLFDDIAGVSNKLVGERHLIHTGASDSQRHPIYLSAYA